MDIVKSLLLLAMAVSSIADRSAPVLVWESAMTSAPALPSLPAMSNSQLQKHLNSLDSEALVMFIMNELNVEDFSGYPGTFPQLRQEFESSQNAFTPSMSDPSQLPAHLDSYSRVTVNVNDLASLKLAAGAAKTLFLVYVNDRPAAERQTALQETDAVISQVLAKVKSLTGKYSAVLTGKHTTMGGETLRRATRSLKAVTEESTGTFLNLGCVFIYTSDSPAMRFTVPPKDSEKSSTLWLYLGAVDNSTSSCNNDTEHVDNVTLSWAGNTTTTDSHTVTVANVTLTFSFRAKMSIPTQGAAVVSSWTLAPVTLEYSVTVDGTSEDKTEQLNFNDVYAPREFSYHCTNRSWELLNKANATKQMSFTSLLLPGFQAEAFVTDSSIEKFGRAWDCTTFFTIPIWSGLFLSLILLLVLIWSMMMLASVPTMDRFDDPRGQPLHVPNAE